MLNKLMEYGDAITLVPQSGIQFVEYGLQFGRTAAFSRNFIERPTGFKADGSGDREFTLIPNWEDDQLSGEPPHVAQATDDEYSVSKSRAIDVFLNRWVPVPFLRIEPGRDIYNTETLADGPMDWVRVRIVETEKAHGDKAASHRVVFAFDTALLERRPNRPYLGISADDAQQGESFRFAHKIRDIAAFLSNKEENVAEGRTPVDHQAWLTSWLETIFLEVKAKQYPNRKLRRPDDFPHSLEHVALYMTFVGFLAEVINPAKITLIDTVSDEPRVSPINVDLVLDIGNARTCGLLIQNFPDDASVDLNRSLVLELKDLSNPIYSYRDPFESHVELVHAEFGPEDLAKKSGRARAFFWPSLVRLGPEASRYRSESEGTESMTDLSSPKRYLWDVDPVSQTWHFHRNGNASSDFQPLVERSIYKYVNNRGDVLEQLEADRKSLKIKVVPEDLESADTLRFSRSSFFTFMLQEIISQALMMINSPASRRRDREKDSPRRLRKIVLTIPSATPVQEQRIIRSRAEAAVKLLWSSMGWDKSAPGTPPMPTIQSSWDEASSVHLVYLYGEITQKLGGNIKALLEVMGKKRQKVDRDGKVLDSVPQESLRIASVDVGGGTTDLMVTTYYQLDNRALVPVQNFREGFRKAGDDLLKLVIERAVIPSIEEHLSSCGLANTRNLLKERFSDDSPGMSEADKHLRRQFVLRLLRPVALGILGAAEDATAVGKAPTVRSFASFLEPDDPRLDENSKILSYLQEPVRRRGAEGFNLSDVPVRVDLDVVDSCVKAIFESVFSNIAEATYKLDADVVLLTGRPTVLPSVINLFLNQYAVSVDKVIPISGYRVGNWYPFRQPAQSLIADPKTTAVVGAMLCNLASGQLTNFTVYTEGLSMRSTARYIGEIDRDGIIKNDKLYFSDVDLDDKAPPADSKEILLHGQVQIGYRQIARESWVTSPLYRLRIRPGGNPVTPPIRATIERRRLDVEEGASAVAIMNSEATSEEFFISDAEDDKGVNVKPLMELKFDTSPTLGDGLYWLDSGILTIA